LRSLVSRVSCLLSLVFLSVSVTARVLCVCACRVGNRCTAALSLVTCSTSRLAWRLASLLSPVSRCLPSCAPLVGDPASMHADAMHVPLLPRLLLHPPSRARLASCPSRASLCTLRCCAGRFDLLRESARDCGGVCAACPRARVCRSAAAPSRSVARDSFVEAARDCVSGICLAGKPQRSNVRRYQVR
jgi:hypothetical protein